MIHKHCTCDLLYFYLRHRLISIISFCVFAFYFLFFFSDPPLSEEDIPAGLWLCHSCRMTQIQKQQNDLRTSNSIENIRCSVDKTISKNNTRPSTPNSIKSQINGNGNCSRKSSISNLNGDLLEKEIKIELISLTNGTKNDNVIENSDNVEFTNGENSEMHSDNVVPFELDENITNVIKYEQIDVDKPVNDVENEKNKSDELKEEEKVKVKANGKDMETKDEEEEKTAACVRSSLEELVRAASLLNPKQFELPREMTIFPKFPGDEKSI